MKFASIFLIVLIAFVDKSKSNHKVNNEKISKETFDCQSGTMKRAVYIHGKDEAIPQIKGLKNEFVILVDTSLKINNFISTFEQYYRDQLLDLDTFKLQSTIGWNNLSYRQKLRLLKNTKNELLHDADSIHQINNATPKQQVWLINNSNDTINIEMQDWLYFCVMQAKSKSGQWHSINYWDYSYCGESYYTKHLTPKTANSFVTKIPADGNYSTKLRFKILGPHKKAYYSNEFDGKISDCDFVEDTANYTERLNKKREPHSTLDDD